MGHSWRSKDEFISDILLWTASHGRASVGRPTSTYLQQLCVDSGCSLEDLPGMMDDWDIWKESGKSVLATKFDEDDISFQLVSQIFILLKKKGFKNSTLLCHLPKS